MTEVSGSAREEWLKSSQIKGSFSRLTTARQKQACRPSTTSTSNVEEFDEDEVIQFEIQEDDAVLTKNVQNALGVTHPIIH